MFHSHSAALSEADMDGMASDGAYNTRAVMVQFQALFRGKFLDARAVGQVYIRPTHRWLSRKQVNSPQMAWKIVSNLVLFELLRYTGQHDIEIGDFLKNSGTCGHDAYFLHPGVF